MNWLRLAGYGQLFSRRYEKNWISDHDAAPPFGHEVPDIFLIFSHLPTYLPTYLYFPTASALITCYPPLLSMYFYYLHTKYLRDYDDAISRTSNEGVGLAVEVEDR